MQQITSRLVAGLLAAAATGCASPLNDEVAWEPPPYFAPENYAEVDGMRLCYLEAGREHERTIVFVHGWSGNVHNWWDQFEHFSKTHHVLVFDLPGHGKSEKSDRFDYSIAFFTETVVALMDDRGIERATVVGNSAGGNIAARVALSHPDRVERLVLVDSTGSGRDGKIMWVKGVVTPYTLNAAGLTTGEHFPGDDPQSRARAEMIRSYVGTREERPYLEALAESFRPSYRRIPPRDLERLTVPTLLVWGKADPVVPKRAVHYFQTHIPDTETLWVEAGHNPNTEAPGEFNCALEAFMEGRPTRVCASPASRIEDETRLSGPSSSRAKPR